MDVKSKIFLSTCFLFSNFAFAQEPINIVKLNISELHPTQPSIGYRQVMYKTNGYLKNPTKILDNYCQNIGAGKLTNSNEHSNLKDINSFECQYKVATHPEEMKTAVQAPNGQYYLTDGHHFVAELAKNIDLNVPVYVVVTPDMRYTKTMAQFAREMKKRKLTWLQVGNQTIKFSELPTNFAKGQLKNDEYRSLMFFLRNIAFDKPNVAPPFYEFYMAKWMSSKISLKDLSLDSEEKYALALKSVGMAMTHTSPDEVIATIDNKNYTVKDFGILKNFNEKAYLDLIQPNGKLSQAFN